MIAENTGYRWLNIIAMIKYMMARRGDADDALGRCTVRWRHAVRRTLTGKEVIVLLAWKMMLIGRSTGRQRASFR